VLWREQHGPWRTALRVSPKMAMDHPGVRGPIFPVIKAEHRARVWFLPRSLLGSPTRSAILCLCDWPRSVPNELAWRPTSFVRDEPRVEAVRRAAYRMRTTPLRRTSTVRVAPPGATTVNLIG
jgi:hypothetical protein